MKKGDYVIVRTYSAGVFAGELVERNGRDVELKHCRRIWQWSGANSLSDMAVNGVSDKSGCMFPPETHEIVFEAIEIIHASDEARASIESVKVWTAHNSA